MPIAKNSRRVSVPALYDEPPKRGKTPETRADKKFKKRGGLMGFADNISVEKMGDQAKKAGALLGGLLIGGVASSALNKFFPAEGSKAAPFVKGVSIVAIGTLITHSSKDEMFRYAGMGVALAGGVKIVNGIVGKPVVNLNGADEMFNGLMGFFGDEPAPAVAGPEHTVDLTLGAGYEDVSGLDAALAALNAATEEMGAAQETAQPSKTEYAISSPERIDMSGIGLVA